MFLVPPAERALPPIDFPPTGFAANVEAGYRAARVEADSTMASSLLGELYEEYRAEVEAGGGAPPPNPVTDLSGYQVQREQGSSDASWWIRDTPAKWQFRSRRFAVPSQAERERQFWADLSRQWTPDVGWDLHSKGLLEGRLPEIAKEALEEQADVSRRSTTMGDVGSFVGAVGGVMSDPVRLGLTLATLPVPFALGANLSRAGAMGVMARAALAEAALATGAEIGAQPGVQRSREMLGLAHGWDEALRDMGMAAAGGAAFGAAGGLIGRLLARRRALRAQAPASGGVGRATTAAAIAAVWGVPGKKKKYYKSAGPLPPAAAPKPASPARNAREATELAAEVTLEGETVAARATVSREALHELEERVLPLVLDGKAGSVSARAFAPKVGAPEEQVQTVLGRLESAGLIEPGKKPGTYRRLGKVPPPPPDINTFLARSGGVRDQGGEMAHSGLTDAFVPGAGRLVHNRGKTLDYAREAAEEAGYLPENSTINDLLDAMDNTGKGRPVYARGDESKLRDHYEAVAREQGAGRYASEDMEGRDAMIGAPRLDEAALRATPPDEPHAALYETPSEAALREDIEAMRADLDERLAIMEADGIEVTAARQRLTELENETAKAARMEAEAFDCLGGIAE